MELQEERKDVIDYKGLYQVSNLGYVKSIKPRRGGEPKVLSNRSVGIGYLKVDLFKDGIRYPTYTHHIVAKTFISNPNNLKYINHKNGNRSDNNIQNLEWCTCSYNNAYKFQVMGYRHPQSRTVYQYSLDGELLSSFDSAAHAGRALGVQCVGIKLCCRGILQTSKGYKWSRVLHPKKT